MKQRLATLIAIWCAAASSWPRRPISSAVTMNSPPSMATVTPIGRPVRSRSRIGAQRGGSKRANSPSGAKRFEQAR